MHGSAMLINDSELKHAKVPLNNVAIFPVAIQKAFP